MSVEYRSSGTLLHIPTKRQLEYNNWLQTMASLFGPAAEVDIRRELNDYVDNWLAGHQATPHAAFCSSWIPGSNWTEGSGHGVYQPIYDTMVHLYNSDDLAHPRAGWCFGLILLDVMRLRADHWECWHESRNPDDAPEGLYYRPLPIAQSIAS